ncbi:pimeloyl-ACP methyl ester carboxylesterase [Kibdelosporangium banguiense]|uniref:Pimeloyl-ACP methyl ester carboxylesterase n=1 Tax=Kibdelosporangium banguiense TaxID=1365924 RepID=A0ABS4TL22_9PSEU|nr:alpha/beta hydrolase [Kibdelosporangium banguiense]MBP2325095.1 pimeloyl-ACP methyl ester carboxylesterase [Kibdelosporangium banguiense]
MLLLIPGGPGNSGLYRPATLGARLPQEVKDRYDLIGFDPRGVGQSTPLDCKLEPRDLDPNGFMAWPGPGGDISENINKARRVAKACNENGGELIRHLTTRNEARDIDQIRRALGERQISYWGVSYGTYAGAVYATMFPGRTDRVVLDSSDDPDPQRVAYGWVKNFAVGAEDRFPDFAAWAAERDATYGLGATPAAVRATFLAHADSPSLPPNALRAGMFSAIYNNSTFPLLAEYMRAARAGDPLPTIPVPPPDQYKNTYAVLTAVGCNDVSWPKSVDHYARAVAQNRVAFPLTGGMPANITACAFWPTQPIEQPTRVTPAGPSNILMIQTMRDPATPHFAGVRMREAFGHRVRLVSVNTGGHGAYLVNGNACGDATVTKFLVDGTRPATDIAC